LLRPIYPVAGGEPLAVPPSLESVSETHLTASARVGINVTAAGSADTMGNWVSLVDPTDHPTYGVFVVIAGLHASNSNRQFLVDIGFGPTGGGNERVLIPLVDAGNAGDFAAQEELGRTYWFPIYIPAGTRVSARAQASAASDIGRVSVWLAQKPLYPFQVSRWTTYGAVVSGASCGTSVTPGNGSFGSWTQVPASTTTSRAHNLWHVGYDLLEATSVASVAALVEIGHGPDSGSVRSIGMWRFSQAGGEYITGPAPSLPVYHPTPAGEQLWARIASGETAARGIVIHAGD
jgi:hypothetical protein